MRRRNILDSIRAKYSIRISIRRDVFLKEDGEERMAASPRYRLGSTLVIGNERLADMARNLYGNEVTNK